MISVPHQYQSFIIEYRQAYRDRPEGKKPKVLIRPSSSLVFSISYCTIIVQFVHGIYIYIYIIYFGPGNVFKQDVQKQLSMSIV